MLKYIAVGDPQGANAQVLKVVQFANSIPRSQIDFIVFCGDIMSSADTITKNIKIPYYLVQGNHDGSNFGPQFYNDVKGHQIVIPQFDWKKYNWAQVDKTKPCLVFVHCPPIPCSSCDSLHKCGQTMRADQLDKLNMRACHSGHLHGHKVDIINKRLYVVESGMPVRTTCCSPNFNYQCGYVRIDDNDNVCYKELDFTKTWDSQTVNGEVVFDSNRCTGVSPVVKYRCNGAPDFQCIEDPNGPFNSLQECQAVCKSPKWKCSGSPDFQCIEDPNGPFNSLQECQTVCKSVKHRCTGTPDFQCIEDPNGPFNSLQECQAVCKPMKWKCSGSPNFQCIEDPNGPFNSIQECQAVCTPPSELQQIIENVQGSINRRYQTKDDRGNVTDTIKIIENPSGGYLGVYHTLISGTFRVKLGTSTDLLTWVYKIDLDNNASQPYITSLSDGGFIVAMEASQPNLHLRFKHYVNLNSLLTGTADKIFDAPRTIPNAGAEGTPNIYSAVINPDINNSVIDVGFHYFKDSDVDRQARGTLINFSQWTTKVETQVNTVIEALGVKGNIGDRDNIIYKGKSFNIIEGQLVKGDFSSWRCFLYDWSTNTAVQLNIKTHKGSKAFANPTLTKVTDPTGSPALIVTLFLPSEGAATGEAGELIYYSRISGAIKYRCTGSPNFQCVEDPNGPFNSLQECQTACKSTKWKCSGSPDFQCVEDPNGPFNSLQECQAVCKPEKKFNVYTVGDPNNPNGVLVVKSVPGNYTSDEACKIVCDMLKNM